MTTYRVGPHVDVLVLPVGMGQDEAQVAADGEGVVVRGGLGGLVEILERDPPQRSHADTFHLANTWLVVGKVMVGVRGAS